MAPSLPGSHPLNFQLVRKSPGRPRYVESDPIGLDGGLNTYGYAGADPIDHIDASGLFFTSVDAACAIDPSFCAEIMGQAVRNAGALSGDPCLEETANDVADTLHTIGIVATLASLKGLARPLARAATAARFTRFEWATMQPAERIAAVIKKYGINLRGRSVVFDSSLGVGNSGKTLAAEPYILRVGKDALQSEEELAVTIAHELRHSRAYLGSGSNSETAARASEEALRDYIRGSR